MPQTSPVGRHPVVLREAQAQPAASPSPLCPPDSEGWCVGRPQLESFVGMCVPPFFAFGPPLLSPIFLGWEKSNHLEEGC